MPRPAVLREMGNIFYLRSMIQSAEPNTMASISDSNPTFRKRGAFVVVFPSSALDRISIHVQENG